ncbi:hypothetical protein [Streptomyces lancefieldiae]|uniref:Transposase n=1 Tax=Streptomyces lancefieldiae TaxID=3075520 RepID=A0ABU3API7_9ACTN|nr:hypothetical protein [Streptomyces sp. DSM 40712]MDT0612100.1 hypothetical protein [Streptomyces sp. DSM 40712]
MSELFIAELRRLQWERIAQLMAREEVAAYVPSHDFVRSATKSSVCSG